MTIRILLLGQACIEGADEVVLATALSGRQGRVAFAYLALAHDHPVARDELADVVWPDGLAKSWERDLSALMSKLKAPLARVGLPDAIRSALGCYELGLPAGTVIDIEMAGAQVEEAEALLRRDAPDEAWAAASVAFNLASRSFLAGDSGRWVESVREDISKVALRAADALVTIEAGRERWADALRYAEDAIRREPFRESGYVALVDVHLAAGNRAEALRAYERARTLLAEELGVPPSAPLEEACRRALNADAPAATTSASVPVSGTVSLVFTDLVRSTELSVQLGAEDSETLRRDHFRLLRDAIATTEGHEVKNLGDGLMVVFARAGDALSFAVAAQQAIDRHNQTQSGPDLAIRVGIHVGEPVIESGDYFGMPVVIAKRLCDAAGPGEILASNLACDVAGANDTYEVGPAESLSLKGLAEPVGARRIRWTPLLDAPLPLPAGAHAAGDALRFVGRDSELASITKLIPSARARSTIVVVAGEPGVGKTRLLAEVAELVHKEGASVLWGRCSPDDTIAYEPFVEALDHVVTNSPTHELRALTGQGAGDLAVLVPRLAEKLPIADRQVDEPDRLVLYEAIANWLTALSARRPLVFVLDDLHWADASTAQLLVHLMRRPDPGQVLFLAAARASRAEWSRPASDALGDLVRTDRLTRIDLIGLEQDDLITLLGMDDDRMHPEGFALVRSLHAATAGNPFFVREVMRDLEERGRLDIHLGRWTIDDPYASLEVPSGVGVVVGQRVDRLGGPASELLRLSAVIGPEFDLRVLGGLTGEDDDALLDRLDEAIDAQLVFEVPGVVDRFAFTHALVRDAVGGSITEARRRRLHRRVAEALEHLGDESRVAEIAHHWCAAGGAGDLRSAVEWARRAGDGAMGQLAYEAAGQHYAESLNALRQTEDTDEVVELDLLLALADARTRAADLRAPDTFREAAALARRLNDGRRFARAVIGLTQDWVLTALVDDERGQLIDTALEMLGETDADERVRLLGALSGELYYVPGTEERRDELSAEAVAIARRIGEPAGIAAALDHRSYAIWGPGRAAEQAAAGVEIVTLAREARSHELELRGHDWVMIGAGAVGDIRAHDDALEGYERIAAALRRPRFQWYAHTRRAGRTALAGNLDEAARLARGALTEGTRLGEADAHNVFTGGMWQVWLERPSLDGARTQDELVNRYMQVEASDDSLPLRIHRGCRTVILALLGERDRAMEDFEWYRGRGLTAFAPDYAWGMSMSTVARAVTLLGTPEEAQELYDEILPFDGQMVPVAGTMWCGAWSHILGLLAGHMERWDGAVAHFEDAVSMYERIGAQAFLARARLELGRVVQRAGDRRRGSEFIAQAAEAGRRLNLPLIVAEAATD